MGKPQYSSTSVARTLLARLPCLTINLFLDPYGPIYESYGHVFIVFLFSIFSDRRSLKIENENNKTKTLTAEVPYIGHGSLKFRFI